ncbi:hypothetical protein [Kineobactrum salinum]|uniref:Uncharacterized protein n=1 Tax=Kineobactrum salinum TaxID=2708301 RepID=A0A6C0UB19_9GAMM|nr:hypothetical protein [Kineobactrum salinum]QIB67144.1 hypothetical protein G3T16_18805 [Kineobactrum salinum]
MKKDIEAQLRGTAEMLEAAYHRDGGEIPDDLELGALIWLMNKGDEEIKRLKTRVTELESLLRTKTYAEEAEDVARWLDDHCLMEEAEKVRAIYEASHGV